MPSGADHSILHAPFRLFPAADSRKARSLSRSSRTTRPAPAWTAPSRPRKHGTRRSRVFPARSGTTPSLTRTTLASRLRACPRTTTISCLSCRSGRRRPRPTLLTARRPRSSTSPTRPRQIRHRRNGSSSATPRSSTRNRHRHRRPNESTGSCQQPARFHARSRRRV